MPQREYFHHHHHHHLRQPWPGTAVVSRLGSSRGSAANPCQEPQVNRIAELPTLILQRVIGLLDHGSRLELRRVDKRCRQAVDSCWRLICIPLDHLRRNSMKQLARRFPATECLVVSEPEQRISLSVLGHRRRCEQVLAVFLDNTAPWPYLVALDLCHALASISANILELLLSSLPSLQHLALPKVAASTQFAHAPAHEILYLVSSQQQLRSLELDCSLLAPKSSNHSSSGSPRGQHNLPSVGNQTGIQQQPSLFHDALQNGPVPVVQYPSAAVPSTNAHVAALHAREHANNHTGDGTSSSTTPSSSNSSQQQLADSTISYASSSDMYSNSSSRAASSSHDVFASKSQLQKQVQEFYGMHMCNPWLQLHHMANLQQLQLVNPSNLQEVLPALAGLRGLASLSLSNVRHGECIQMLEPGHAVSCGQGLGMLQHLKLLTRLELGLEQPCSSCTASSVLPAKLMIPPHSSSDMNAPGGAAVVLAAGVHPAVTSAAAASHCQHFSCCWSHLKQLKVLVLSGVCLDCALITATAGCEQLTELRVGGIALEHEIHPAVLKPLQELKVLSVSQCFDLGGNDAAALFPGLTKLSIRDGSGHCPDLSCLKHHPTLSSLFVEAAGAGWQLSSLQLGYLVHVTSLKQLSLASRWCGGSVGHHHHPLPHQQALASPGRGSFQQQHAPLPRPGLGLKSPSRGGAAGSNSAHWLPSASLTQVTSLTLSGPCNDHTLSQLPNQFPGMMSLQLLGSYYASDQGLKRLCRAPQLSALLLDGCDHVTEYGIECIINSGSIRVLVVQGCGGVDERACQRIRRACRNSCTCLHWHGTDGSRSSYGALSNSSGSGHISPYFDAHDSHHHHHHYPHHHVRSSSSTSSLDAAIHGVSTADVFGCDGNCHCSSGSAFLERCWQEAQADKANGVSSSGPAAGQAVVAGPNLPPATDSSRSSQVAGSGAASNSGSSQGSRSAFGLQEELATLQLAADTGCSISAAGVGCTASELTAGGGTFDEARNNVVNQHLKGAHGSGMPQSTSTCSSATFYAPSLAVELPVCTQTGLQSNRSNSKSATVIPADASMHGSAVPVAVARSSSSGTDGVEGGGSSDDSARSACTNCNSAAGDSGGLGPAAASWPRRSHPGQTAAH